MHIGLPKTGTTAVQRALTDARPVLERRGVLYPGSDRNQWSAATAMLGLRPLYWPGVPFPGPDRSEWDAMVGEIRRAPAEWRRVISAESLSAADATQVGRIVADLGPVHVLVAVRPLAEQLVSNWQQRLRVGLDLSLDDWLARILPPDADRSERVLGLVSAEVVARWADRVGFDAVTVVVIDGHERMQLDVFESMLGLDSGDLRISPDPVARNRSLTPHQAAVLLRVNSMVDRRTSIFDEYMRAMHRVIDVFQRRPDAEGARISLPWWARPAIADIAGMNAEGIRALGVTVVGELDGMAIGPSEGIGTVDPHGGGTGGTIESDAEIVFGLLRGGAIDETSLDRIGRADPNFRS